MVCSLIMQGPRRLQIVPTATICIPPRTCLRFARFSGTVYSDYASCDNWWHQHTETILIRKLFGVTPMDDDKTIFGAKKEKEVC